MRPVGGQLTPVLFLTRLIHRSKIKVPVICLHGFAMNLHLGSWLNSCAKQFANRIAKRFCLVAADFQAAEGCGEDVGTIARDTEIDVSCVVSSASAPNRVCVGNGWWRNRLEDGCLAPSRPGIEKRGAQTVRIGSLRKGRELYFVGRGARAVTAPRSRRKGS